VSWLSVVGASKEITSLVKSMGAVAVMVAPDVKAADPSVRLITFPLASRNNALVSVSPVVGVTPNRSVPFTSTLVVDSLSAVSFPAPSSMTFVVDVAVPLSSFRSEGYASLTF